MARLNSDLTSIAPFTMAALTFNIVLFGMTAVQSHGIMSMNSDVLAAFGASQREGMWQGQWFRMIMPMFLHGGLVHIAMNMNFLWRAGPDAEVFFGTSNYGTIYILSGVCGECLSQIFGGHLSIGASGSLCGIMGAHLAVLIVRTPVLRYVWRNSAVRAEAFQLLFLFGIGILGFMNMDNWGHFGGAAMGFVLGGAFELWRNRRRIGQLGVFASLIASALLVCAARWTVFNPTYHIFMSAYAKDENRDSVAQKYHADEARKWAEIWTPIHFLGVVNVNETNNMLRAHELGLWDAESASSPYYMMNAVKYYRHGDYSWDLKEAVKQLKSRRDDDE